MSKYKGYCIAVIGTNGTGKSTWMKTIIDKYKRNVLILMDDDSEEMFDIYTVLEQHQIGKFKGKAVCYPPSQKKLKIDFFKEIYTNFGFIKGQQLGGLLVFDDAMTMLSTRDEEVMQIFKKRRQRKLDIILNCHGFSEYPISLVKNTTHVLIKKTLDSTKQFAQRLNSEVSDELIKAVNHVNKESENNPYYEYIFDLKDTRNNKKF